MPWNPKRVGETETFTADFAGGQNPRLAAGETIVQGSAVWTCVAVDGVDPNAQSMVIGPSTISGGKVSVLIGGGISGVTYRLTCAVQTSVNPRLILPDIDNDLLYVA
jgi:hypothetical protein